MKKLQIVWLMFLLSFQHAGFSQKVYEWYQDGKVIFQTKVNASVKMPKADANLSIEIKMVPFIAELKEKYEISRLVHLHPELKNDEKLIRTYQIEFNKPEAVDQLIAALSKLDFIEYAEKKELHRNCLTPNDLGPQSGTGNQWGLWKINAQQAWDVSTGSANVVVAVVDDAINNHPDLVNKFVAGRDVVDNDNDPSGCGTNDGLHGSHVSGIVGAQTNNGTGVASIGWNVSIMPIKIGDCNAQLVGGYNGIIWAANNGADVINMSWGGAGFSNYGQNVCNNAAAQGSILVAAAGNSGNDGNPVFYPAAYNNVIAVANTQTNDTKAPSSQYGTWLDISAPGTSIRSCNATTGYASLTGTSMASPMVAGLMGLMKSAAGNATNAQLINCLLSSAENIDAVNPSYTGQIGAGRIDAYQAMLCVTAAVVDRDASISAITAPTGTSCVNTISPVVVLSSFGSSPLTSVTINYQIDNGTVLTYNWSGTLTSGQSVSVSLPAMTVTNGAHTFNAYTSNPNNSTEQNPSNDASTSSFASLVTGLAIPFSETFESNSTSVGLWNVENPDNDISWQLTTVAGTTPGTTAAGINFFNYSTVGQRDGLLSPSFNFATLSTASMSFEHAFRRYDQSSTDSLIIYVSTNCGQSFTRIWERGENGTGTLATVSTSTVNFVPQVTNDWCMGPVGANCFTINLDAFVGQSNVIIKFEGYNNYGNNLYLDNINITGAVNLQPTANFTANNTTICPGQTVAFSNQSTPNVSTWNWSFTGGSPATSTQQNPTITYNTPGVYAVSLQVSNANGSNTMTQNGYITVNAAPSVSINADDNTLCPGESAVLTALGANTYSWNQGLGSGSSKTVTPAATTQYTVIGTNTSTTCTNTASINIVVNPNPTTPAITQNANSLSINTAGTNTIQWFFNGNPIANANGSTLIMQGSGMYMVVVTDGNGCTASSSGNFEIQTTNLLNMPDFLYEIYPSPANEVLTIRLVNLTKPMQILLSDGLGRELLSQSAVFGANEQDKVFEVGHLPAGVYFLTLNNDFGSVTEKVIIAR